MFTFGAGGDVFAGGSLQIIVRTISRTILSSCLLCFLIPAGGATSTTVLGAGAVDSGGTIFGVLVSFLVNSCLGADLHVSVREEITDGRERER